MKPHPGLRSPSVRTRRLCTPLFVLGLVLSTASAQQAPVASFTTNPSPAVAEERLIVQFLDRSTGDVTSWHWDFGDGSGSTLRCPELGFALGVSCS